MIYIYIYREKEREREEKKKRKQAMFSLIYCWLGPVKLEEKVADFHQKKAAVHSANGLRWPNSCGQVWSVKLNVCLFWSLLNNFNT